MAVSISDDFTLEIFRDGIVGVGSNVFLDFGLTSVSCLLTCGLGGSGRGYLMGEGVASGVHLPSGLAAVLAGSYVSLCVNVFG